MKSTAPKVIVDINQASDLWDGIDFAGLVRRPLEELCGVLDLPEVHLSVLLTDDASIATLNEDFRGKAQPTNVLSWPSEHFADVWRADIPFEAGAISDFEIGDLALAFQTFQREAAEAAIPLENHLIHLTVHGALHCLGFDHQSDETAEYMEELETKILARLGIPDPYCTVTTIEGTGA
ncbi:MAG: rRNA maturation RNase YbeY [Pseudomonadota bacterium]